MIASFETQTMSSGRRYRTGRAVNRRRRDARRSCPAGTANVRTDPFDWQQRWPMAL